MGKEIKELGACQSVGIDPTAMLRSLVDADIARHGEMSSTMVRAGLLRDILAERADLLEALEDARAQLEAYELERSGEAFNDTRINAAINRARGQ